MNIRFSLFEFCVDAVGLSRSTRCWVSHSMLPMDDDPSRSLCGTLISAAASLSPADPSSAPSSFGNLYRYRQSTGAQTSSLLMPNSAPRPSTAPQHSFGAPSALLSAAAVLGDLPHPSPLPAPSPFSSFNNVQARAPAAYGQLMGSSTSLGMGGGTTATLTSPGVFSNLSLGVNEGNTPTPSLSSLMTSTSGVSSSFTGDFKLGARQPEQNQVSPTAALCPWVLKGAGRWAAPADALCCLGRMAGWVPEPGIGR